MKKRTHFLLLSVLYLCLLSLVYADPVENPAALSGVLDLRTHSFKQSPSRSLEGEWLFYPQQLLSPTDLEDPALPAPTVQHLPGYWSSSAMPAHSFATYAVTVMLPREVVDNAVVLGLRISDSISACSVWIDNDSVFSSGVVGRTKQDEQPQFKPGNVYFTPRSASVRILIQVSNHNYRVGGIWAVPRISIASVAASEWSGSTGLDLFLLGALLIMVVNQSALFISRRKERSALWFACLCLFIALRIVVTGNSLLTQWIPTFSWEIARKFEFLPICLGPVFFALFIHELFPECMKSPLRKGVYFVGLFFALLVLALPAVFSSYLVIPMEIYLALVIVWLVTILCRARIQRLNGSGWLLVGYASLALTVINDILFSQLLIRTVYLLSFGFFCFIGSQVILLARTLTHGFNRSEEIALELETTNKSFGRFVPTQFLKLLNRDRIIDVELGDQIERSLTVLFSDIRQFTSLSERMSPRENFTFLNTYLRRIGPCIRENGGFIDKYVGDAIMALFPDSVQSAVDAGIAIQRELALFNQEQRALKKPEIEIGLGLHCDVMALGTIGEQGRMDTTVIADAVNLASRLESLCKVYGQGIILLEAMLSHLGPECSYRYRKIGMVQIRGKKDSYPLVQIYEGLPESRILKIDASRETWEHALLAYQEGDLPRARALFELVVEEDPEDLAANYLFIQVTNELYTSI